MSDANAIARARERFVKDTAEHEMSVLRDDGLYRHLRFQKPGTSMYYFDLVTWPGSLAIVGDYGDYVFSRLRDMFEFFRPSDRRGFEDAQWGVNPGYWAEKLRGPGHDTARSYSTERFTARVLEWLASASEDLDQDEAAALRAALDEQVLSDDWGELQDEGATRLRLAEFEHKGRHIEASEWDLREFDQRFLWCCWAIVWGIGQYRAAVPAGAAA